jgi:uncharacterized protein
MLLSRLPKPLLWGAVPLSLGGLYLVSQQVWPLMELGLILAGLGWLGWQVKRTKSVSPDPTPEQVTPEAVQQTLSEANTLMGQLTPLAAGSPQLPLLQAQAASLVTALERESLQIAVLGAQGVGKTCLIQQLAATAWPCTCIWQELALQDLGCRLEADLVVFVIQADITQPEYAALQTLHRQGQRTLVVWNKQDQFLPADHQQVLQQLKHHLASFVAAADLLTVSAQPGPIQVRQHQSDGTVRQWQEQPLPQLQALQARLAEVLRQEARQLVVHQNWHQAQSLKTDLQDLLNRNRQQQALPIIERYQWIAAGTAALSPLPALDLLGVGVVTVKMVQEIGAIYQQSLSLEQAQAIGKTLAGLILKLGLVELSSQALSAVLKANSLTYLLGAGLQGMSTAYLTRVAGLTLVAYFQAVSSNTKNNTHLGQQLGQHLRRTVSDQARPELLQALAKETIARLPLPPLAVPLKPPLKSLEPLLQERD